MGFLNCEGEAQKQQSVQKIYKYKNKIYGTKNDSESDQKNETPKNGIVFIARNYSCKK